MNTLKIIVESTGDVAEWEIVGELPTMNTVNPTKCKGGWEVAVNGYELQSGGILHHLRQCGHFRALDMTF